MPTIKEVLQVLILIFFGGLFFGFGLSTCEYEQELQEAKNKQWVLDSKADKPFTNYNGE